MVQVIGKITDVEKSEMEVKAGENGAGQIIEIEGPGHNVVTPAATAGVVSAVPPKTDDIPITLLKLKVEEFKMVAATCPQGR